MELVRTYALTKNRQCMFYGGESCQIEANPLI
jgi:hypothetical protein